MRRMVYIASPYRIGNKARNVMIAMSWWRALWSNGFSPVCPLWSHFQHCLTPLSDEEWLEYGEHWLTCCDAVLRLPGQSVGADREVKLAGELDIPVFTSLKDLVAWRDGIEEDLDDESNPAATETILEEATRITAGDRQRDYDHPKPNHDRIARLWQAYLASRRDPHGEVTGEDVARMMILLKVARDIFTPKRDNLVDIAGYARCLERMRSPSV